MLIYILVLNQSDDKYHFLPYKPYFILIIFTNNCLLPGLTSLKMEKTVHLKAFFTINSPPQVKYKKGHNERKAKYTSLADPPEVELARRVADQRSDVSASPSKQQNNIISQVY